MASLVKLGIWGTRLLLDWCCSDTFKKELRLGCCSEVGKEVLLKVNTSGIAAIIVHCFFYFLGRVRYASVL